jgi:hypothetical protein
MIESGGLAGESTVDVSPLLRAVIDGFKASRAPDIADRIAAAIAAVEAVPPEPRPDGTHAEPPEGDFRHMLGEAAARSGPDSGEMGHPGRSVDPAVVPMLTEIERHGGAAGPTAHRNSLTAIGAGQDAQRAAPPISPPPMTAAELRVHIAQIVDRLAA